MKKNALNNLPQAPTSIRIGPYDFEIRWWGRNEEEGKARFGETDLNNQVICLPKTRKRQKLANTFIHEVLHACQLVYGRDLDKEGKVPEEDAIVANSIGLCAFFRENREAAEWWQDLMYRHPQTVFEGS